MRLQELINEAGWHPSQLDKTELGKPSDAYSMAEPISTDFDLLPADDSPSELEKDEIRSQVEQSLTNLTQREQIVIRLYYGFDGREKTLREIGIQFGVGVERTRQILAKALRKLRHPSRSDNLRPYLIDEDVVLNEVTAFQEKVLLNHDWQRPQQVMKWLRKKGFKQKGAGAFGAAFVHPNYNRIIKISKKQDICWLRFAHWTLKMTANPSVPYMHWVHTYGGERGDEFFIAVIEKLEPFNLAAVKNTRDLPGLIYMFLYEEEFSDDAELEDRFWEEGIISDDVSLSRKNVRKLLLQHLRAAKSGKNFINTLRAAKRKAKGKCSYDMHDGNLMYRPSDQRLVIIDPLADLNSVSWDTCIVNRVAILHDTVARLRIFAYRKGRTVTQYNTRNSSCKNAGVGLSSLSFRWLISF